MELLLFYYINVYYSVKYGGDDMFTGQKHKERFLNEIGTLKQSHSYFNRKFLSALYTITSVNSHQLWQFAKSMILGDKMLLEDIIDKELYSDKNFKIIIDAIKIARKGLNLN